MSLKVDGNVVLCQTASMDLTDKVISPELTGTLKDIKKITVMLSKLTQNLINRFQ